MHTRQVRFTSQLALVGVILVGTVLITRHMERIVAPTSAGSSECATIPEMPRLPEPSVGEDSAIIGQTMFGHANLWQEATGCFWQDSATGLMQSDEDGYNLELFDSVFGTPTSSLSPFENQECDAHDFNDMQVTIGADSAAGSIGEDELVSYSEEGQETITKLGPERPSNGCDTTETPPVQNIEQTSDTVRTSAPAEQVLTKVRTKFRCLETVLRKAVIEPYQIDGKIEGLRITGLDGISVARDLLIKSGDIIRAINGQPLNSKRQAYKIFKKARTKSIMTVDLLRDGEVQALLFDFQ